MKKNDNIKKSSLKMFDLKPPDLRKLSHSSETHNDALMLREDLKC